MFEKVGKVCLGFFQKERFTKKTKNKCREYTGLLE